MKKRSGMILAGLILVSAAVLLYGIRGEAQQRETVVKPDADATEILVYSSFFSKTAAFYAKADEIESKGGDGSGLRNNFKSEASLTGEQAHWLDQIARDFIREKGILDARQKAIVEASRAPYPGGQLPQGQLPPPQPPELGEIKRQREQLCLRMRDQLKNTFGDEAFGRFDTAIRKKIVSNTTSFSANTNEEKP